MRIADWLALLVFPGGLVILTLACFWLFVGLVRQGRTLEASVAFLAFLGLGSVVWLLHRFFISP